MGGWLMDAAALPGFLAGLKGQVATAAAPAANAMAEKFQSRVQNFTLRQSIHPPGMYWEATVDRPPAYASGTLVRSIIRTPAFGGIHATALVGATAVYAAIQEFGGDTWPSRARFMHWTNTRGGWYMKRVTIPQHPYMRPTVEQTIRDGSLQRSAISAFQARMSPLIR
jgi:phage gpG-like protein